MKSIFRLLQKFPLALSLLFSVRAFGACTTVAVSSGWQNTSIAAQTGVFTASFDATPSASPSNAIVALSNGVQTAYSGFACMARFNPSGNIDARNGGGYTAASAIPFSANLTYHFRFAVNIPAHTYSVYVTPPGGVELVVGSDFAFRTEQSNVSSLNYWGAEVDPSRGSETLQVCNFSLSSFYAAIPVTVEPEVLSLISSKWSNNFTYVTYPTQVLGNVITVNPGNSIQSAIDSANAAGGGVVLLKAGTHVLTAQITLKSKVTLFGEGRTRTIIKQDPSFTTGTAFGAGAGQLTDVVITNLTLDGLQTGSTAGIILQGSDPVTSWHSRIMLQNVDVTNWAGMGVHMKRTANIIMSNCNFQHNGAANGLYHNIYFLHVEEVLQSDCDMSFPVLGKGNKYTSAKNVIAQRCIIQGCNGNGIQADNSDDNHLFFHKYNISNCGQVAMWFPCENFNDKNTYTENPTYAPQFVILNRCNIVNNQWGCMWRIVGNSYVINSVFSNTKIDLGLLKCGVVFEGSTLSKPAQIYTDVSQWPADVPLLW